MEELNEQTLDETIDMPENTERQEAAEELPGAEEIVVADEDADEADEVEDDSEGDEEAEEVDDEEAEDEDEADGPDMNREALRKFIDLHQLLGIFHQRVTNQAYRDRGRILGLLQLKDGVEKGHGADSWNPRARAERHPREA